MPPELKAVADRLSLAAACRRANGVISSGVAIIVQRLAGHVATGEVSLEKALATALAAEAAALSVPHVPPLEPRDVRNSPHPSFF
ncbi:hypothetical protein SAMN02799631_06531 [Methylobacterium sp. 174MFSha1.1]|uniref:hypothetical protein n=1 Tax=Methylobacterium sp. 174MFSha1.1 TaxID=1502749 RepID=UPI0008EF6023|nr:hypothetical protein [Methylobacterium sp. 174MFSha1.1]SFV16815.1 hypothetical protein SAMN02799631_06531 [Methylobacterium sp. 174MFSha1.1]